MDDWDAAIADLGLAPPPSAPLQAGERTEDDWSADLSDAPVADGDDAAPSAPSAGAIPLAASPDAAALKPALLAAMEAGEAKIDAASVERLSGPVLQVLLAAMRDERAAGRSLVVANPSFAFSLAFEAYGFGSDNEPFIVEYT